ncbi:MAG: TrbI/VirB10 family protein [Vampirovibrionales bacterium]
MMMMRWLQRFLDARRVRSVRAAICLAAWLGTALLGFAEPPTLKGGVTQSDKMSEPWVNEDDLKTLEPGTQLNMALTTTLNTAFINQGDSFFAKVTQDYKVDGKTVIPKGTMLHGVCEEQQGPKRAGRNAYVTTRFDYLITPDGREIPIEGKYTNKDSAGKAAAKVVGRAAGYTALGGVLGAITVLKYGGLAAVAASNGYALAGGAAVGGAIGLEFV